MTWSPSGEKAENTYIFSRILKIKSVNVTASGYDETTKMVNQIQLINYNSPAPRSILLSEFCRYKAKPEAVHPLVESQHGISQYTENSVLLKHRTMN